MSFCENCGSKLEENSLFCEECGHKVEGEKEVETPTRTSNKQERKPLTKKQRLITMGVLGLLLTLFIGHNIGKTVYSEENQTNRITEALASKDAGKIANVLTTEDAEFEVTTENLEGFAEYLEEEPDYLEDLIWNLETYGYHDAFRIVQTGTKMGLYDAYELVLTPIYGYVHTNAKEVTFFLGEEELFKSDSDDFSKKVGPYAPGFLTFSAEGELNGFPLTVTEEVTWLNPTYDFDVNLYLSGSYINVRSDLEEGTVYVDGKSIGELEGGYGEFGPIQIQEGMEIHVAQTFGEEKIISDPIALTEDEKYYEFFDLVLATSSDVSSLLNRVYSDASSLSVHYDSANVENMNSYFHPDGPAFEGYRTELLSEMKAASNNEDISNVRFDLKVNEVKRVGVNSFDVEYEVSYLTNFAYQTRLKNGLKHYKIKATAVFEPTKHPNRDFDSYVYEIESMELVYEEGHGKASATTSESGDDEASAVVSNFVKKLPDAVNNDNFAAIAPYIDPSSAFYDEQSSFVSTTHKNGITEKLDNMSILDVTLKDDGTAQVKSSEKFTIYNDGSESQTEYEATYSLKKIDGKYLITGLSLD